ncbi:MAG: DUF4197 domain-containing protein [Candidatus Omnitrophica bacterium]|nr:DUF4197 domain-containing protein [Candidatus Omnitrophota bacterium]
MPRYFIIFAVLAFVSCGSSGELGSFVDQFDFLKDVKLSDSKIASGLKEALKVGIDNAVKLTGKTDGYFANEAIKILIPEKLKFLEQGLRALGFIEELDEFVLSMNRAAEKAAPYAKDIFIDAIFDMSFDDARKILEGSDTAATDYFKKKTEDKLLTAFRPVVERAMKDYKVTSSFQELIGQYKSLPFASSLPSIDIEEYVIDKGLEGLFYILGEQEKKIRNEPAARVTQLLQEVFK